MDISFNTPTEQDRKEIHNPKNKQEAFCFQMMEDIRILRTMAVMEDKKGYNHQTNILKTHLEQSLYGI